MLMDLRLPELDGVATIRALHGQSPVPQVLVLTAFYDEQLIPEAWAAGACGYVLKQGELEELFAAFAHMERAVRPSAPGLKLWDRFSLHTGPITAPERIGPVRCRSPGLTP
jgi:DNA-binding NarL/FixJ family response regulator